MFRNIDGKMQVLEFDFATPITEDITLKAFFGPDEGGASLHRIAAIDGAPEIDSENLLQIAEATLTEEEIDENYGLVLVSSPDTESGVPEAERKALTATASNLGATPGLWFDISLYKLPNIWMNFSPERLKEDTTVKLTTVSAPVRMTAEVPKSLQKDGRTYYLLACHDGVVTVAAKGTNTTFSWESDKFSTYLIAYQDASGPISPKTGESNQMLPWLVLTGLAAGVGILAAVRVRRER